MNVYFGEGVQADRQRQLHQHQVRLGSFGSIGLYGFMEFGSNLGQPIRALPDCQAFSDAGRRRWIPIQPDASIRNFFSRRFGRSGQKSLDTVDSLAYLGRQTKESFRMHTHHGRRYGYWFYYLGTGLPGVR